MVREENYCSGVQVIPGKGPRASAKSLQEKQA